MHKVLSNLVPFPIHLPSRGKGGIQRGCLAASAFLPPHIQNFLTQKEVIKNTSMISELSLLLLFLALCYSDATMTVRRYSTTAPAPTPSSARSHQDGKKPPSNGLLDTLGSARPPAPPAAAQLASGEEKALGEMPANYSYSHSSKMKLFQEHIYKCR